MKLAPLLLSTGLFGAASAGKVTPVEKVIEMMQGMLAKGQADAAEEVKIFKSYSDWVHDQDRDTKLDIGSLKSTIEKQDAIRVKAEADAEALGTAITQLNAELAGFQSELAAATKLREEENAEYQTVSADYEESFDALSRAIVVLKNNTTKISAAFLQTLIAKVPRATKELAAFLQQPQAASYAYESQSGGVVELLKGLKQKFRDELAAVQKAEANQAHNYQLMKMNLDDEIANTEDAIATKTSEQAAQNGIASDAKRQLVDARAALKAAEKYLADLHTTFTLKSQNYEGNQKVRAEEIEALSKAIEIISGGAVSGSAKKHLPTLVQESAKKAVRAVSFLQKAKVNNGNVIQRVSAFLQAKNKNLLDNKSNNLSLAAFRILAASHEKAAAGMTSPFDKVVGMIKDMISKLESEAAEEAEHKAFCDKELKENKLLRNKKTDEVNGLQARAEELSAMIANLGSEIAALEEAEAGLVKAMNEATEQRSTEKAKNTATIADAKAAQDALKQALGVLEEFYGAQGASLLQGKAAQVPEMKIYKGQGSSSGGVVGMLEVIQSDFARLEADTTATENQAQAEYDAFMTDAKADKEAKHKNAFDKKLLKDRKEHALHGTQKDLASTEEELAAAVEYFESLKPQCLAVKVSYEERVRMREEEIKSLQEALDILSEQA
jgi:hypothetical protein